MGRHGRKPHKARGVCSVKGSAFTTWDAAMAAVVTTPGAERPYRGTCCGYFHITRLTEDEFAQRVAEYMPERRVQETWVDDTVDTKLMQPSLEDTGVRQQEANAGDAGSEAVERLRIPRLAPSPREIAQRLARRSGQEIQR